MIREECVDFDQIIAEKRRVSLVELLRDLYDSRVFGPDNRSTSFETDCNTDDHGSLFSDSSDRRFEVSADVGGTGSQKWTAKVLGTSDICTLKKVISKLKTGITKQSQLLVCYLKRRDHQLNRLQAKYDFITAVLQALSPKRSVDSKLQFSPLPLTFETGFDQWLDGMKAVARLPDGIPEHFRQKLWITLANHYLKKEGLDWETIKRMAFNDRMNPNDDELSLQIVKDLHRTGWSGLDGEQERILLRRVLLAYARYNKNIGYCQGFNVIVALILEVMEYNEDQALKVTIMLLEKILPADYFDQTLRALSIDMAVLRDLMHSRLPRLSAHLDHLQRISDSEFEPPLVNVFSMQWFLTLFATCLPKNVVYRIWDSLILEGSEILLRTALALWAKTGRRLTHAKTADSFYTQMGPICEELANLNVDQCNQLLSTIYSMAEFPYPGLDELRDKHMFNIQPFSSTFRLLRQQAVSVLKSGAATESTSDAESSPAKMLDNGADDRRNATPRQTLRRNDKSGVKNKTKSVTDVGALEKQYKLLRQRQKQAAVIVQGVLTKGKRIANGQQTRRTNNNFRISNAPDDEIFNHLYVNGSQKGAGFTIRTMNGILPLQSKIIQPSGKALNCDDNSLTSSPDRQSLASTVKSQRRKTTSSTCSTISYQSALETVHSVNHAVEISPSYSPLTRGLSKFGRGPGRSRSECDLSKINIEQRTMFLEPIKAHSCCDLSVLAPTRSRDLAARSRDWAPCENSEIKERRRHSDRRRRSSAAFNACLQKETTRKNSIYGQVRVFNPFPVRRESAVIERGKKIGLYS